MTADDKLQAVVGLVLQAVDQRLATVRDQVAELANVVARQHAVTERALAECRALAMAGHSVAPANDAVGGVSPDTASRALLEVATMLSDRVGSMESHFQRYIDGELNRLRATFVTPAAAAIEKLTSATASSVAPAEPAAQPTPPRTKPVQAAEVVASVATPPAAAADTAPPATPVRHVVAVTEDARPVAAPSPAPPAATATAPSASAAAAASPPVEPPVEPDAFDLDAFTARLNERLSALVDQAIG